MSFHPDGAATTIFSPDQPDVDPRAEGGVRPAAAREGQVERRQQRHDTKETDTDSQD